jgi:hypothetical protein
MHKNVGGKMTLHSLQINEEMYERMAASKSLIERANVHSLKNLLLVYLLMVYKEFTPQVVKPHMYKSN